MARIPYSKNELYGRRPQRVFTDEQLKEIAFPLGGIGTGTISLGGRGDLRDWEIFNRPAKGKNPPYTFVSIWAKKAGSEPVARVLESRLQPSFVVGAGMPPEKECGLPRLKNARFRGEYPLARIDFEDSALPVEVSLEAFNPFIPLNDKDSGIPVAILRYTVKNTTNAAVDFSIAFSLANPIGYDGVGHWGRGSNLFGANVNEYMDDKSFRGFRMTGGKPDEKNRNHGTFALVTTSPKADALRAWDRGPWWDGLHLFWNDFSDDGRLQDNGIHNPSPDNTTDIGSLCPYASLKPGESTTVTFLLAWHFPNGRVEFGDPGPANWYGTQFKDAWDVARYTVRNLSRLEKDTQLFHDALFSSTLPETVLDAASANMSIMRTNTCMRAADGRFFAFEGCGDDRGCCPLNCTHVWNYEQAVAYLFPALERTMRLTDFQVNLEEDGKMAFRTRFPLVPTPWKFHAAADGQMGCILKLYREWQLSGDRKFLEALYPQAKRAIAYAWVEWDKDKDGVMEAIQHNTYDIEFLGANTMMGSLYLGALRAMEIMANEMGDTNSAKEYREIFDKGAAKYDQMLWNGEFYVQEYDPEKAKKYQFGKGCLSDQMLGQWFSHVAEIGYVLPKDHVKKAMKSIFDNNWKPTLADHYNCQRTYALNDEAGLLLCSWPNGGRPALPFVYSDEVWTGIEYQVAAHLIYEGLLDEGLAIVKGVHDRHNGSQRNPWNEFECGHHYARAMSSWSVLLALGGFHYSAPAEEIGFKPKIEADDFRTFFSVDAGWGTFSQKSDGKSMDATIDVLYGKLPLKSLTLAWPKGKAPKGLKAEVTVEGKTVAAKVEAKGKDLALILPKTTVTPGGPLVVRLS